MLANPQIPLGAILIRRRRLTSEQLAELIRVARGTETDSGTAMFCLKCRVRYRLKGNAAATTIRCPRCRATLVLEVAEQSLAVGDEGAQTAPVPPEVEAALQNSTNRFGKFIKVSLLGEGGMGSVRRWSRKLRIA